MDAVAGRAGVVKGTIYLYFATKEELLLALFQNMMLEYFDEVDALLAGGRRWSPSRVAATIADALLSRPPFARMFTVLGSILEHNISYESAVAFKHFTLDRFTRTGALLAHRLGLHSPGEGLRLMLQLTALITGLAQMSYPAPVLERVFKDKRLRALRVDFRRELLDATETLFRGIERRKK
ncbi:MAG: TetR family transcriptional regulator, partial [Thermoanaerobaculia bacterium]